MTEYNLAPPDTTNGLSQGAATAGTTPSSPLHQLPVTAAAPGARPAWRVGRNAEAGPGGVCVGTAARHRTGGVGVQGHLGARPQRPGAL